MDRIPKQRIVGEITMVRKTIIIMETSWVLEKKKEIVEPVVHKEVQQAKRKLLEGAMGLSRRKHI